MKKVELSKERLMASDSKQKNRAATQKEETPSKLKLSDKLWVALVIVAFIVAFVLIVIYDVI